MFSGIIRKISESTSRLATQTRTMRETLLSRRQRSMNSDSTLPTILPALNDMTYEVEDVHEDAIFSDSSHKTSGEPSAKNADTKERYWTGEEHRRFLEGLIFLFPTDYVQMAQHIGTRTVSQVRSHIQKYSVKLARYETETNPQPEWTAKEVIELWKSVFQVRHEVLGDMNIVFDVVARDFSVTRNSVEVKEKYEQIIRDMNDENCQSRDFTYKTRKRKGIEETDGVKKKKNSRRPSHPHPHIHESGSSKKNHRAKSGSGGRNDNDNPLLSLGSSSSKKTKPPSRPMPKKPRKRSSQKSRSARIPSIDSVESSHQTPMPSSAAQSFLSETTESMPNHGFHDLDAEFMSTVSDSMSMFGNPLTPSRLPYEHSGKGQTTPDIHMMMSSMTVNTPSTSTMRPLESTPFGFDLAQECQDAQIAHDDLGTIADSAPSLDASLAPLVGRLRPSIETEGDLESMNLEFQAACDEYTQNHYH